MNKLSVIVLLFTLSKAEYFNIYNVPGMKIKEIIKETFSNSEIQQLSESSFLLKGIETENISSYIIETEIDKKTKIEWKDMKISLKIEISEKKQKTEVKISTKLSVLGYIPKILVPPAYVQRESNGLIEEKFLRFLWNEIEKRDNPEKKELIKIFKRKKEPDQGILGPPFEPNIDLITEPPLDTDSQNELSIAIKKEKLVAGWNDYRGDVRVTVGCAFSHNAGFSWSDNIFPGEWAGGYPEQGDPVLDFGKGDSTYFIFITFDRTTYTGDLALARSFDAGKTWPVVTNITNTSNDLDDKPWISVYNDTVFVTWARFFSSQDGIKFIKSTNSGQSFTSPLHLNSGGNGSIPKKGPGGVIYVVWGMDSPSNSAYDFGIYIRKSTDNGNSFLPKVHVADGYSSDFLLPWRIPPLPSFDVDMNNGYLYVAFASTDAAYSNWDIYISRSTNQGNSFQSPVKINDITTGHQFFPWISVDESGIIHCIWYDTRTGGYNLDIYYAYSDDYAQTFSPSMRVTDATKPPVWQEFIGDYIAVDATNYLVGAAWCHPATNNISDDAWFSRIKRDSFPASLAVIYPNGGEIFLAGDTIDVLYSITENTGIAKIYYSFSLDSGATYTFLDSISYSDSVYTWILPPDTVADYVFFKVETRDYAWNYSYDTNDAPFRIIRLGVKEKEGHSNLSSSIPSLVCLNNFLEFYADFPYKLEVFDILGRKTHFKKNIIRRKEKFVYRLYFKEKGIYFLNLGKKTFKILVF